jgi:hypothetical protein
VRLGGFKERWYDARHILAAFAGAAEPDRTSLVALVEIKANEVLVRGLDCLDGTPLIDLKPDRCSFTPLAPPQKGDFETG